MNACQRLDRFQLNDNDIFNDEIRLKHTSQIGASIDEWHSPAHVDPEAGFAQLNSETFAVNRFE